MELDKRFRKLVGRIQQLLGEEGFVTRGQTFWRPRDKFSQAIILKRSRWNTQAECDFWFVIGVFVPELYAIVFGDVPPAYPKEGYLALSLGIDAIPFYPRDRIETLSWKLFRGEPSEADERLWADVAYHLQTYAVPFLGQFSDLSDVIKFLDWLRAHRHEWFKLNQILPSEAWLPIHLAVLYWLVGDRENCLRELEAYEQEETTAYIRDHFARVKKYLLSAL